MREITFIFLALPRQAQLKMKSRLEHVAVASPDGVGNFGPVVPFDGCRTVAWSAGECNRDITSSVAFETASGIKVFVGMK